MDGPIQRIEGTDQNTEKRSVVVESFDNLRSEVAEMEQRVDDLFTQFNDVLSPGYPTASDEQADKETQESSDLTRATRSLERRVRVLNSRLSDLKLRSEL